MMGSNLKRLAVLMHVSAEELAHMIGYNRSSLYVKRPNHTRDTVSKKILIQHSDKLYEQDIANAELSKKMREAEIDKMF